MCFSPEADFTAALPLLFGIHQFTEGFVWLGLRGEVSAGLGAGAKEAYIVYAHAILPAIVPLGFTLLEPERRRARWMWPLAFLGLLLGVYMLWQVTAYPVGAQTEAHCIDYTTHAPNDLLIGVLYVAVTCGPALISSRRYLRWFGLVSLAGVIAVALVRADELTSLWCLYVAMVSVLILEHFRRQRSSEARAQDSGGSWRSAPDRVGS